MYLIIFLFCDTIRLQGGKEMKETEQQRREREHQEDLQRLRGFRPMDDDFMRSLFQRTPKLVELVLRIITEKPDLKVVSFETQADMKRVTGARSICLDAYATDSTGKKYDIEVQRADRGASPQRARYHSSVMDVENLDQGQQFGELPDTYTIFITEKDFYGEKAPIYRIQRMNLTTGKPFADGANILYVNGEYRGESDIGLLMHDFNCTDPEDMKLELMADCTRYLKESPEGVSQMCREMERMRDKSRAEGRAEGELLRARETAINLHTMGMDVLLIAKAVNVSAEQVRQWLEAVSA